MTHVRISEENLKLLKDFREKLTKISGMSLSLNDTIGFILKYGPEPEEYWFKNASYWKKKEVKRNV
jgi:hypothetical protein